MNPKHDKFRYYGGRGIRVSIRWDSFENFLKDMGPRPTPAHQIDRKDNDGDYTPGNCHWVMSIENNRNRNDLKLSMSKAREIRALHEVSKLTHDQLAKRYGVVHSTITKVINGDLWPEEFWNKNRQKGAS